MVKKTLPPEQRIKFFVYIIESPNPPDVYHKRYEGDILQKALSLDEIPSAHRIVVNEEAFRAAFLVGLREQMNLYSNLMPIIHISAHGGEEGIELTNGNIIQWITLKNLLAPINKALKDNLLLCMSSCKGFSACAMAMSEDDNLPFFAVIGNTGEPTWSDTAIAYTTFYHLIAKGCYVVEAVKAMCEASNDDHFQQITSKKAQKAYLEVINEQKLSDIKLKFEEEAKKNPPSKEVVDLEKSRR